jgi:hypothetical protein
MPASGGLIGSVLSREEDMLAWTDPVSPLDTRRLSEFSTKPENSHGARSAYRPLRYARV